MEQVSIFPLVLQRQVTAEPTTQVCSCPPLHSHDTAKGLLLQEDTDVQQSQEQEGLVAVLSCSVGHPYISHVGLRVRKGIQAPDWESHCSSSLVQGRWCVSTQQLT